MFPDEFTYYEPESVDEAVSVLADEPDAEVLAGGHSLLPTMKSGLASPDVVVDIGSLDALRGIEVGDDVTTIGGRTRYASLADSDSVADIAPVLTEAAAAIGDVQVRNMGTVGGNLAHSDPAADLPAAALAADVTVVAQGPDGERRIPIDDFFQGMYMTALAEDELLTAIEVPRDGTPDVGAYAKKPSPSSGFAVVGVAAALWLDGETVTDARVAANGAMDCGVRLDPVEEALTGEEVTGDRLEAAAERACDDLDVAMMMDDNQASNEYRAGLLEAFTRRALASAVDGTGAELAAD